MPLDTSIARSIKPLQVQFRDLGAEYNQLAQMQSAESQNQLAQMQMQEARQLAPLRMQEQQSRAALTKLELDEANEANTIVNGIMAKIAEFPDAPRDPFQAAEEMINSTNPKVRAGGEQFLKSLQILQTYKNQRDYETSQQSSVNGPAAPMVAPFETSAQLIQTSKPYAEMSNAERIAFDISRIGNSQFGQPKAVYTLEGQEVPFSNYVNANIANSANAGERAAMASMPNALAGAVAPSVATEPVANAMVKPINPLQDAAALMKQIQDGDDRFARGGTPAPGWKNKRDLLVKALEQALKPGRGENERYLPLGAGKVFDQYTREVISADRVPATAATPKIINIKGVPHTLNEEGNLEALPIEGAAPAAAAQPQAVASPKITTVKGVPYTFNFETGRLEPVPVEGGASTAAAAQPQAAPKIINIKGVPHIFNVDKGKLERVPVEGGLPIAAKGGAGKATADGAGGEKMPTGSILVIDPTDTAGKRVILVTQARAIKESLTPASSVATGKEGGATEGERKAATLLQRLQFSEAQLTDALVNNPNAAKPGVFASAIAMLSTPLANSLTPEARQRVQSAQLDILDAALTLGTGAAYTREQLEGYRDAYFPQIGDKPNQIKDKQARLNNVISAAKIAAGKAAKLVPPAPAAAGGSSAMSEADKILNKDRK